MLMEIKKTAEFLKTNTNFNPKIGVILGTGLGGLVDEIEITLTNALIPTIEIQADKTTICDGTEITFSIKTAKFLLSSFGKVYPWKAVTQSNNPITFLNELKK